MFFSATYYWVSEREVGISSWSESTQNDHLGGCVIFRLSLISFNFYFCFDSPWQVLQFQYLRLTKQKHYSTSNKWRNLTLGTLRQMGFHIWPKDNQFQLLFVFGLNEFSDFQSLSRTTIPLHYSRHIAIGRVDNIYGFVMGIVLLSQIGFLVNCKSGKINPQRSHRKTSRSLSNIGGSSVPTCQTKTASWYCLSLFILFAMCHFPLWYHTHQKLITHWREHYSVTNKKLK